MSGEGQMGEDSGPLRLRQFAGQHAPGQGPRDALSAGLQRYVVNFGDEDVQIRPGTDFSDP
jgi:hypothetical protein